MAKRAPDIERIKSTEPYILDSAHESQTLDVYQLTTSPSAVWIIFLHGGAWRDPTITSSSGTALLSNLLNHVPPPPALSTTPPLALNAASLNYRLSPHPSFPGMTQNVAKHPDHINDVLAALAYLRERYQMREYVFVGHSAGAMLSFMALSRLQQCGSKSWELPKAIYGIEGIYDLGTLAKEYPDYKGFIEGAFGEDADAWPAPLELGGYRGLVVLVQSDEDELLSWNQTEEMKERCENTFGVGGGVRVVKLMGAHDEVLRSERLAGVVDRYLREIS